MFISRLIWIVVFLTVSSLSAGLLMVESKPLTVLPSPLPTDGRLRPVTAAPATSRSPSAVLSLRHSSRSPLHRAEPEESNSINIHADDDEEHHLRPVVIRKYALHSRCSGRSIRLLPTKSNMVRADAPSTNPYAQLTVRSVRPGEVSISNDITRLFLCFNRQGKLIMRPEYRDKYCGFHELNPKKSHFVIQSAYNKTWFVGFGRDGNSLRGAEYVRKLDKNRGCYNFMKSGEKVYQSMSDISHERTVQQHNNLNQLLDKHLPSRKFYSTVYPGSRQAAAPVTTARRKTT
ncbi:fibroblast growth factor 18-like [Paramacrobiotus metropolitanus]|uniref:fibroblast growth factor 18-like n=1 Tax=Paramacrobiotus metropolitanus TaxID=2943436 RepID=UPI0024464205|nr:fibroblast growth factor 18-like [Paramacrobiotus metropolitanus]